MAYFKKGAQLERMSKGMVAQLESELSIEEKDAPTVQKMNTAPIKTARFNSRVLLTVMKRTASCG